MGSGICVKTINGASLAVPTYNLRSDKRSTGGIQQKKIFRQDANTGEIWKKIKLATKGKRGAILCVNDDGEAIFQGVNKSREQSS